MKLIMFIACAIFMFSACKSKKNVSDSKALTDDLTGEIEGFQRPEQREDGIYLNYVSCPNVQSFLNIYHEHAKWRVKESCISSFELKSDVFELFMRDIILEIEKMSLNGAKVSQAMWQSLCALGIDKLRKNRKDFYNSACYELEVDGYKLTTGIQMFDGETQGEKYAKYFDWKGKNRILKINRVDYLKITNLVREIAERYKKAN